MKTLNWKPTLWQYLSVFHNCYFSCSLDNVSESRLPISEFITVSSDRVKILQNLIQANFCRIQLLGLLNLSDTWIDPEITDNNNALLLGEILGYTFEKNQLCIQIYILNKNIFKKPVNFRIPSALL